MAYGGSGPTRSTRANVADRVKQFQAPLVSEQQARGGSVSRDPTAHERIELKELIGQVMKDSLQEIPSDIAAHIIIPDAHGRMDRLHWVDAIRSNAPSSYRWLAVECFYHTDQVALNGFLKTLKPGQSDDQDVFSRFKVDFCRRDSIFFPNDEYISYLLQLLIQFDYIYCLDNRNASNYNYQRLEASWARFLPKPDKACYGVILVGAAHVLSLNAEWQKLIGYCTFYSVYRDYKRSRFVLKPFMTKDLGCLVTLWA